MVSRVSLGRSYLFDWQFDWSVQENHPFRKIKGLKFGRLTPAGRGRNYTIMWAHNSSSSVKFSFEIDDSYQSM